MKLPTQLHHVIEQPILSPSRFVSISSSYKMELTIWFAVLALAFIAAVAAKIAGGRIVCDPVCARPLPPVMKGNALVGILHTLYRKGLQATLHHINGHFGSVFTISFLGKRITFLVGPEVSGHFFQGLDSDISHGNLFELMVPIHGKEVAFGVDAATRKEQARFIIDALKPSQLRIHAGAMLQEVEVYT
jgi:sterol 14alpha-demethylase